MHDEIQRKSQRDRDLEKERKRQREKDRKRDSNFLIFDKETERGKQENVLEKEREKET